MHILVLLKMVPDVVEDLEIAPDGKALDLEYLRMILSESDDHALEQALLMKERHGGKVTVLALDAPEVDDALFTAMAKGADRVVKVVGMDARSTTRQAASVFAQVIRSETGSMPADLVLTGVQAIDDLDGLIANYTAFATEEDVRKEIAIQQLILGNERRKEKKPGLALRLARLLAATGDHRRVVELLTPFADVRDANRCELLLELGHSLCCLYREKATSAKHLQGRRYLEESARLCACEELAFVPHLRNRESLHARALFRLGWALAAIRGEEHEARRCFRLAHEHEPANPYYLSAMLGFELRSGNRGGLPASMATTIREAVRTCCAHAAADPQDAGTFAGALPPASKPTGPSVGIAGGSGSGPGANGGRPAKLPGRGHSGARRYLDDPAAAWHSRAFSREGVH